MMVAATEQMSACGVRLPVVVDTPASRAALEGGCARGRRNVYIDMGANWCNTLRLFRQIPGGLHHESAAWSVYAFEAAPLIMPFVERCCEALSRGESLPNAPVPPSGSSTHLLKYARTLGCEHGSRAQQFVCIEHALNASLHALHPDYALLRDRTLLNARLDAARSSGCTDAPATNDGTVPLPGPRYTLIPAGVGVRDTMLSLAPTRDARGLMQLLRGGVALGASRASERDVDASHAVPVIDVIAWLRRSFSVHDHVVIKMDVEWAENELVPALLATNTTQLIDVLLWECHLYIHGHAPGRCQCAQWDRELRASGIKRIYHDPYPFAKSHEDPPFAAHSANV
jgi:hypothetical protein